MVHSLQLTGTGVPGRHARTAKAGRICGDYFVVWLQRASDDEYLSNSLNLPHWNNREPCVFCSCNDTNRPWTDCREGALWQHQYSSLPTLAILGPGGLTTSHICIDELHNGALGVLKHSLGSCFWVCVHFANILGSFRTRANMVWKYISEAYDELEICHRLRVPYLKFLGAFGRQTSSALPFCSFRGMPPHCKGIPCDQHGVSLPKTNVEEHGKVL